MSKKTIQPYTQPAGGWGALRAVASHLLQQDVAVQGAKTLLHANQPDGFDCPGCAWPDRDHTSTFEFCENGAKAVAAEATARRATPELFAQHSVTQLAKYSDYWLEGQGRLTHPLRYDSASDHYVPVNWDAAFALIATHLNGLASPDEAIFYTSGRTSNEAAFLYQLFVREFGTNNFPDCSNMCHEPSGTALESQIGVGKGTVSLHDFELADAIFIFGQNPGTNHPRMLGELRQAAKRGAAIVSFNPLRERGLEKFADPQDKLQMLHNGSTRISSDYFQLKIGGDLAAVKGIIKHVLERDAEAARAAQPRLLDLQFITRHTANFDAFAAEVIAEPWATIVEESGLSEAELRHAGEIYLKSERLIACWGMGITQHKHSVATIHMIANLLLLRGHLGRPGAGACPVRGHSNVQGDRTMMIYEKPPAAFLDRLQQVFGFEPPRASGFDTVGAIEAMGDGRARTFFGMGGNFATATPDTEATHRALRRCDLTVHVTTKLNRSHLVHGRDALILPCLGRTEIDIQEGGPQSVSVEDSMSMVHLSAGINPPASPELLSEPAIVARLAEATLGTRSAIRWRWLVADYDRIRELIAQVFEDFADFNTRVRVPGGFRLSNTARDRVWDTPEGRAVFKVHAVPTDNPIHRARRQHPQQPVFTLATTRSHDQYNTTIYGLDDRYRGVFGERRVLFINAADIADLGLQPGAWVDLESLGEDGVQRHARRFLLVAYNIPRGCLAAYYPETNGLVPLSSFADEARTPTSKSIPVLVTPHRAEAADAVPRDIGVALVR
ncbi:FdhF/YdeP family oxidoreductase [Xanthomonas translucens pv. undulosa]|uniref:FdhF/YdeP family oxidoreductase n=1 Tax=Xanthomonas campestris pv. translucens TaxID=343 RepID=UPI00071E87D5|nr:FdhF/YdeP family oxidoreductase [Xanthomonas translucens]QEO26860.1 FdhF/YdeP family oxidoreductase [Xanthomonas translucens pv. undulosa]QSQ40050.1 FdhF/YdeP family oxidoreductase [Xanthomonas translucens pv. translucens]QSQ48751.1 FdhF/YdeP family oxidoreductase [Xanthomonas translucens pv. undulosa]UJB13782.1 FdhF/YdeP family oxidoreductase [Xanthomonas translucens pv. undulosa]WKZ99670.1 FdhF/YdeP family oxidoreductase [Xanthomonas translucens]